MCCAGAAGVQHEAEGGDAGMEVESEASEEGASGQAGEEEEGAPEGNDGVADMEEGAMDPILALLQQKNPPRNAIKQAPPWPGALSGGAHVLLSMPDTALSDCSTTACGGQGHGRGRQPLLARWLPARGAARP